jgi:hypothetical protein
MWALSAGDNTFHSSPHPIPGAPATMTGRGLHYTEDGGYVDVWEWKATSSASGWMDDAHFRTPAGGDAGADRRPYTGGFAPDPGRANYADNFSVVDEPGTGANPFFTPGACLFDCLSAAVFEPMVLLCLLARVVGAIRATRQ